MGRKNVVSERIIDILGGKLLRFTTIHDEYKKRYKKAAYKQVADNLRLLQQRGIVSYFCGHYYLIEDSDAGKLKEEQFQLARENVHMYTKKMEDIVQTLDNFLYLFAVGLVVEIPFHLFWDKKRLRKLIVTQQEQLEGLMKILEMDRL